MSPRSTRQNITAAGGFDVGLRNRIAIVLSAATLGSLLLFGAGFAQSSTLHDAAHDARHAFTFPCH